MSQLFFDRLGVAFKPPIPGSLVTDHVGFRSSKKVKDPRNTVSTVTAVALYRAAILQFGYFNDGLYDLQDPVSGVLPEPSENFVRAHNLSGVLDLFF